jgi:hypothetical protein
MAKEPTTTTKPPRAKASAAQDAGQASTAAPATDPAPPAAAAASPEPATPAAPETPQATEQPAEPVVQAQAPAEPREQDKPAAAEVPELDDYIALHEKAAQDAGLVVTAIAHPSAKPRIHIGVYSGFPIAAGDLSATYSDGSTH